MMTTLRIVRGRKLRAFCFDCEARPGPWIARDFTSKQMLSLAGRYEDEPAVRYIGPGFTAAQLERWARPLREGPLVITHNGFNYDLPLVNGTLLRMGLEPLPPLLVHDTWQHLLKRGRAFSGSLGNLCERFGVTAKGHMSENEWEAVYAGDREALKRLRTYNVGDVVATLELRAKLLSLGYLRPPRIWRP